MNLPSFPPHACYAADHEIAILRLIDAPPQEVFAAWIEPRQLRVWWGPRAGGVDWQTPFVETDPRRGGTFRTAIRGPQGETQWASGVFRELDPPRGLAFTHAWETEGRSGEPRLVLIDFAPADGRTRLTFSISGFPSVASRDSEIEGWHDCLDRLVRHFSSDNF